MQLHLVRAAQAPLVWNDFYKFGEVIVLIERTDYEECGHYFAEDGCLIPAKIYMDQQTAVCPCVPFSLTQRMTNASAKYDELLKSRKIQGYCLRPDDQIIKQKWGCMPKQFSFLRVSGTLYIRFNLEAQDVQEKVSAAQRKSWFKFDWQKSTERLKMHLHSEKDDNSFPEIPLQERMVV